jgi:threonine aldolase
MQPVEDALRPAQLVALLTDDLYRRSANHANAMAGHLRRSRGRNR